MDDLDLPPPESHESGQVNHRREAEAPQEGGFEVHWSGGMLAVVLTLVTALSGGSSYFVTHTIDLTESREQQRQNDQIADHERRLVTLERIADDNTKGRVRLETNQQYMIDKLSAIESAVSGKQIHKHTFDTQ